MDFYWSVEQCGWVPCPSASRSEDERLVDCVPQQREREPVAVEH